MPWHGRETLRELQERAKHSLDAARQLVENEEAMLVASQEFAAAAVIAAAKMFPKEAKQEGA